MSDRYTELVRQFRLRRLRSDEDLNRAMEVIDSLLLLDRDEGEQDYLDVLTSLVWWYESETIPMPPVSDARGRLTPRTEQEQREASEALNRALDEMSDMTDETDTDEVWRDVDRGADAGEGVEP